MSTLSDIRRSRDLLVNLTLRELRGKYKRSLLGWTWSMLNPLASMLTYTLVFSLILQVELPPGDPSGLDVFPLFLLCGLLPWSFIGNSMTAGMESLIGNANLVKKVYFPREVLVASTVASFLVTFLIELGVLVVALLIAGNLVLPWLLLAVPLVAVQCAFALGLALLLSVTNVYFRDMRHIVGIVLQVWFYLTPIVYPISYVTEHTEDRGWMLDLYKLNPMTAFVEAYRDLLYDLRFPAVGDVCVIVAWSAAALVGGIALFRKLEPRLAEEL